MAPNSPSRSFTHASIAGSRSTVPLNRSNGVLIVALLLPDLNRVFRTHKGSRLSVAYCIGSIGKGASLFDFPRSPEQCSECGSGKGSAHAYALYARLV